MLMQCWFSGLRAAHGDARPNDIMVCVQDGEVIKLKVIDMDWAGAAGTVVYPALVNTERVVWPEGVAPGKVLEQRHDRELLHLQGSKAYSLLSMTGERCFQQVLESVR